MLVLTRKQNEQIVIDGGIVISVVELRGDKVRIGIDAPGGVRVDRREVYEARKRAGSTDQETETPRTGGPKDGTA